MEDPEVIYKTTLKQARIEDSYDHLTCVKLLKEALMENLKLENEIQRLRKLLEDGYLGPDASDPEVLAAAFEKADKGYTKEQKEKEKQRGKKRQVRIDIKERY